MRRLTLLVVTLLVGACGILGPDEGTVRTLEVAPFRQSCFGLFATLCLQVREPGESAYRKLFDTPEGFDFEWGVAFLIEVEEREVDPVPADGPSIRRTLRRVLSRTPESAGATFELFVAPGGLTPVGEGRYIVYAGPEEVTCDGAAGCAALAEEVGGDQWLRLALTYSAAPGEAFGAERWELCEGPTGPCIAAGWADVDLRPPGERWAPAMPGHRRTRISALR